MVAKGDSEMLVSGFLKASLQRIFIVSVLVFLAACGKTQDDVNLPVYDGIGGDFSLPSTQEKIYALSDQQGKVILLTFGFTHCPDVCPMVLTRLAKVNRKLQEKGIGADRVQTLFISVDPERDTLQHLKEYLAFFNPDFIGLCGSPEQLSQLTAQYAAFYQKETTKSQDYQVMHTDRIFLIDKRGRLRALYAQGDSDEKMLADIISLAESAI